MLDVHYTMRILGLGLIADYFRQDLNNDFGAVLGILEELAVLWIHDRL